MARGQNKLINVHAKHLIETSWWHRNKKTPRSSFLLLKPSHLCRLAQGSPTLTHPLRYSHTWGANAHPGRSRWHSGSGSCPRRWTVFRSVCLWAEFLGFRMSCSSTLKNTKVLLRIKASAAFFFLSVQDCPRICKVRSFFLWISTEPYKFPRVNVLCINQVFDNHAEFCSRWKQHVKGFESWYRITACTAGVASSNKCLFYTWNKNKGGGGDLKSRPKRQMDRWPKITMPLATAISSET